MVDHLLRRKLQIKVVDGRAEIAIAGVASDGIAGRNIHVLVEDAAGKRREIASSSLAAESAPLSVSLPGDARKVAAFVRGDGADGFVAAGEVRLP
jgi:acyl transferase domain-containing protein